MDAELLRLSPEPEALDLADMDEQLPPRPLTSSSLAERRLSSSSDLSGPPLPARAYVQLTVPSSSSTDADAAPEAPRPAEVCVCAYVP